MRKNWFILFIALMMGMVLVCNNGNVASASLSKSKIAKGMYKKLLREYHSKCNREIVGFDLLDLNSDGIQELLISDDWEEIHIYTYKNGNVKKVDTFGSEAGCYSFIHGKNIICTSRISQGFFSESLYKYSKGKLKYLGAGFEAIRGEPDYNENKIYNSFTINNKDVKRSAYKKYRKQLKKGNKTTSHPRYNVEDDLDKILYKGKAGYVDEIKGKRISLHEYEYVYVKKNKLNLINSEGRKKSYKIPAYMEEYHILSSDYYDCTSNICSRSDFKKFISDNDMNTLFQYVIYIKSNKIVAFHYTP